MTDQRQQARPDPLTEARSNRERNLERVRDLRATLRAVRTEAETRATDAGEDA